MVTIWSKTISRERERERERERAYMWYKHLQKSMSWIPSQNVPYRPLKCIVTQVHHKTVRNEKETSVWAWVRVGGGGASHLLFSTLQSLYFLQRLNYSLDKLVCWSQEGYEHQSMLVFFNISLISRVHWHSTSSTRCTARNTIIRSFQDHMYYTTLLGTYICIDKSLLSFFLLDV